MTAALGCGETLLSAAHVTDQILRVAQALERSGVKDGDVVGILMRNEARFVTIMMGARHIGAYALPINWHFQESEAGHLLTDSNCKLLFIHSDLYEKVRRAIPAQCMTVKIAPAPEVCADYRLSNDNQNDDWLAWLGAEQTSRSAASPRTPMGYTSGTTGRPKGVRRDPLTPVHLANVRRLNQQVFKLSEDARVLLPTPLYHSAPNVYATTSLQEGALLIVEPRFNAERTLQLIQQHKITHAYMVPTLFVRLLQLPQDVRSRYDVSSIKSLMHGAAPCPKTVKQAMIDWFGPVIDEFYGGSEAGPIAHATSHEWLGHPGTVGKLAPGVEILICDENGRELPATDVGTIYVKQTNYPDFTYHGRPELREAAAHPHAAGFFTLGDVGYRDRDGYLFISDRKADMIISGGVNIYPAEIESVLVRMPGVQDCAVFGAPDEEFGECVAAVVEPAPDVSITADKIRQFLQAELAHYKVPRIIDFSASLPREESGKIFKRKIRAAYWAQSNRNI